MRYSRNAIGAPDNVVVPELRCCGTTNTEPGAVATGTVTGGVRRQGKLQHRDVVLSQVPPGRYRSRFCILRPTVQIDSVVGLGLFLWSEQRFAIRRAIFGNQLLILIHGAQMTQQKLLFGIRNFDTALPE